MVAASRLVMVMNTVNNTPLQDSLVPQGYANDLGEPQASSTLISHLYIIDF